MQETIGPFGGSAKDRRRQKRRAERDQGTLPLGGTQSDSERGQADNGSNHTKNAEDNKTDMREIWNKISNWQWNTIFTGILCLFTFFLWRVSYNSNETAKSTQRAFLNFDTLAAGPKLVSDDRKTWNAQTINLRWANSGTTPARDVIAVGNYQMVSGFLQKGFNFPTDEMPRQNVVIGPKGAGAYPLIVPMDQISATRTGNYHLYFWGSVIYHDAFPDDQPRLTEFCAEMTQVALKSDAQVTPEVLRAPISDPKYDIAWNVASCREHNCYDEDCKDYKEQVEAITKK